MSLRTSATALALAVLLTTAAQAATLFTELGERPGLERLVDSATAVWTADPRIADTFDDTNMPRFKRLLVEQFCQLAGGGCSYAGRSMQEAHRGLHLNTKQFNALVEGLQVAMDRLDVGFPVQNRFLALLAPMYRDVVTR